MAQGDDDTHKEGLRLLSPILMSLLYHGAGFVVVYRYHKLGIYIVRIFQFNRLSVHVGALSIGLVRVARYCGISLHIRCRIFGSHVHCQTPCAR